MSQLSSGYKSFVWVLAFSLLTGGTVFAANDSNGVAIPATATGTSDSSADSGPITFSDVKSGHWAEKSITKLSLQGIITGNNGLFRPSDGLTQEEAVVMALRLIGKEKEVSNSEDTKFPESFVVDNYYKNYVALAFQLELLDQTDEFAAVDADQAWGRKTASREWMTKLIVRAAGKKEAAAIAAGQTSSFSDAAKISNGYLGYINAAVSLGLVTGVTPKTFEPQTSVTRAAAATLFSRAQSLVDVTYEGQTDAVLTGVNGNQISVYTENENRTYTISSGAKAFLPDADSAVAVDKLTPYTNIRLLGNSTTVYYMEQLDTTKQIKTIDGTISKIVPSENKIWLWVGNDAVSFTYDSSVQVKDSAGTVLSFSSLAVDSDVVVTQDTFRATPATLSVEVKSAPVNTSGEGKVADVDATAGTITIAMADGTQAVWQVSSSAALAGWDGRIVADLSGIQKGDTINFTIKDSKLTAVSVKAPVSRTISGIFYSKDNSTVTYLVNGNPETKFLADFMKVSIEGMSNASLDDLYKDDDIQLTLNDAGKVTAITVLNRQINVLSGANIVSYDGNGKVLTVKGSNGKLLALQLSDKTKLDFNGTAMSIASASNLLSPGHRVSITYNGTDAVALKFVYQYTGTVSAINTAAKTLSLKLEDDSVVTLSYTTPTVEWLGKPNANVSDIVVGSKVTAGLDSNQENATRLSVISAEQYTISSVNLAAKTIRLQSASGAAVDYSTANLAVTDDSNTAIPLSSLGTGGIINVTFAGTTPVSMSTVKVTGGRINSISASAISLDVYGGGSTSIQLGSGFSIVKNNAASTLTSTLSVGDRVQVKKNAAGAVVVTVISGVTKTFWKYDTALNQIQTKRLSISDNDYKFDLNASTVVTVGGNVSSASQLKDGDSIVLYMLGGVVLEVVKP